MTVLTEVNEAWFNIVDWVVQHGGPMSQEQRLELRKVVEDFTVVVGRVAISGKNADD